MVPPPMAMMAIVQRGRRECCIGGAHSDTILASSAGKSRNEAIPREGPAGAGRLMGNAEPPARCGNSVPVAPSSGVRTDADTEFARPALHRRSYGYVRRR